MLNFLALLGWSPGGDRELMTLNEMIELFSPQGLQKKAAIFDPKKLEWMNGQHLSMISLEELEPRVTPAIIAARLATEEELVDRRDWYLRLLDLLRVRSRTIDDIVRQAGPYFLEDIQYDPAAVAKNWKDQEEAADLLRATRDALAATDVWEGPALEAALRGLAEQKAITAGKVFQPLRVALTGMTVSPGIFEMLVQMGRELSLKRIDKALVTLAG
jgi:glutamyl/glutaminyl-tRNA synthetase